MAAVFLAGILTSSFLLTGCGNSTADNSSDSSSSSSTSQNDSMGGMGMQMFSFGGDTYTSQSQEMVIDSVHITVGQEIQAGDVLYTLTEDSVEEIRTQLEEDVEDTLADYQALTVEQQQSYLTAKQDCDTYVTKICQ